MTKYMILLVLALLTGCSSTDKEEEKYGPYPGGKSTKQEPKA